MDLKKKLTRSSRDQMLFGVCGGLAEYTEVDATVIRLALVFLTVFTGLFPFVAVYILAALVMPLDVTVSTVNSDPVVTKSDIE